MRPKAKAKTPIDTAGLADRIGDVRSRVALVDLGVSALRRGLLVPDHAELAGVALVLQQAIDELTSIAKTLRPD